MSDADALYIPVEQKQWAELVRAAKQRDELLAALTDLWLWVKNWDPSFTEDDDWPETANKVKKAIANAES